MFSIINISTYDHRPLEHGIHCTCNFFFFFQECGKFEACAGRGLHAHHPRDCLFFLRDFDVEELQQFLQEKNVEFDTEPPKEQVEAAKREKQKQREEEAVAANGMCNDSLRTMLLPRSEGGLYSSYKTAVVQGHDLLVL